MAYEADFREFWQLYPLKRDRLDAVKAYCKARATGATREDIVNGVQAYVQHKPSWQAWKHAATWLNKGGFLDEWDAPPTPALVARVDWYAECQEMHGGECGLSQQRHANRKAIDAYKGHVKV